jgi:hypothetical protein
MGLDLQLKIGNWILKLEFVYCSINKKLKNEKIKTNRKGSN